MSIFIYTKYTKKQSGDAECAAIFYNRGRRPNIKMKIEHYSFGRIVVGGKAYTGDMIIYPDKVDSAWWRKEGHRLQIDDLADVIKARPEVLVIGAGYSGVMAVPEETISHLESLGIVVHVERTTRAVELFNELQKTKKAIAALHLTC
ncbi:MAG: MTH938/NDUFAF3 family protein [Nitrospirota bacterium]